MIDRLLLFQIITAENGKPLADARGEITYGGASRDFLLICALS
jgi:hypothetical protein